VSVFDPVIHTNAFAIQQTNTVGAFGAWDYEPNDGVDIAGGFNSAATEGGEHFTDYQNYVRYDVQYDYSATVCWGFMTGVTMFLMLWVVKRLTLRTITHFDGRD